MYETASKRVYKSERCVLFMTFNPSQRTLFMARRNWVPLALTHIQLTLNKKEIRCNGTKLTAKVVYGVLTR